MPEISQTPRTQRNAPQRHRSSEHLRTLQATEVKFCVRNSPQNDGQREEDGVEEQDPLPGVPGGSLLRVAAADQRPVEDLQDPGRQDGPDGRPAPVGVVVVEEVNDGPNEEPQLDQRHRDVKEDDSEVEPAVTAPVLTHLSQNQMFLLQNCFFCSKFKQRLWIKFKQRREEKFYCWMIFSSLFVSLYSSAFVDMHQQRPFDADSVE